MTLFAIVLNVAKAGTVLQILLFLPLTLSTLSTTAFLSLSLLLFIHALVHASLLLCLKPGVLSFLQLPVHPILLLLAFNLFSGPSSSSIATIANYWGLLLRALTPFFIAFEAIASLLVAQAFGQTGKRLAQTSEPSQFALLISSAVSYVGAVWWIVSSYSDAAQSPMAATLLGVYLASFVFLTLIGFSLRRSNVIESSCLCLYLAFNIWLSGFGQSSYEETHSSYSPLLENIMPHLKALLHFVSNSLPKPVLGSLIYRLSVLHLSTIILPSIGADFHDEEDRPTNKLTQLLLTYRQAIFITTYTHLLLLEPALQVWWRHIAIVVCLSVWALELLIATGDDDDLADVKWKVE